MVVTARGAEALQATAAELREALTRLPEREALVLQLYYVEELNVYEIAEVLDVPMHQVIVEVRRMGGGFGGKETQANPYAAIAALAADVSRYYESLGLLAILPLELPKLVRPVGIIWNRQRPVSPSTQALMQCLGDVARIARSPKSAPGAAIPDSQRVMEP